MTDLEIIDGIIHREGRTYTNRPADKGGPTKFGITLATLSRWRNRPVTADDVRALSESEARAIYLADYVTPWAWVTDDDLRTLLVEWGVTSGFRRPCRALQAVVGAEVDGIAGPETQRLTRAALVKDPDAVYGDVLAARIRFYVDLALDDPPLRVLLSVNPTMQIHNLRGWLNRCAEFI